MTLVNTIISDICDELADEIIEDVSHNAGTVADVMKNVAEYEDIDQSVFLRLKGKQRQAKQQFLSQHMVKIQNVCLRLIDDIFQILISYAEEEASEPET